VVDAKELPVELADAYGENRLDAALDKVELAESDVALCAGGASTL